MRQYAVIRDPYRPRFANEKWAWETANLENKRSKGRASCWEGSTHASSNPKTPRRVAHAARHPPLEGLTIPPTLSTVERKRDQTPAGMVSPAQQNMESLAGRWRLNRTVLNRGVTYLYAGTATITSLSSLAPWILQYRELTTETNSTNITGTRELLIEPFDGMAMKLTLKDGGHISTWNFAEPTTVTYQCGRDIYVITCEFTSGDSIEEHWRVLGPHKKYSAHQTLVKVADFVDPAPGPNQDLLQTIGPTGNL